MNLTDPMLRTLGFTYDLAGRVRTQALPGGRTADFNYDASGNLTWLTPPGRPAHGFGYTSIDQTASCTPPVVPGGGNTSYGYDFEGALSQSLPPDGTSITTSFWPTQPLVLGNSGKLQSVTTLRGTTWVDYDAQGRPCSSTLSPQSRSDSMPSGN